LFKSQDSQIRPLPDWEKVHNELHSKSYVTLQVLWQEYINVYPYGYSYQRFCFFYRQWAKRHKVYMRQRHIGGEKLFVDYSGKKPCIHDLHTGQKREVELLVMCWGVSQHTYMEAHESQSLPDWIMGHRRGYEYFGCAPHIEVDDNLKSSVNKACRYDPDLNRSFTEFAEHYGVAVVPARSAKPKDKAKVENAVLLAQRWVLACIRNRVFYSLAELNQAIRELNEIFNDKRMQKLPKSRRQLFLELDKPNALALPSEPFEYREWKHPRVGFDYHIEVDEHFYSVPWTLAAQIVSVRIMERTVEVLYNRNRVALHQRSNAKHHYTTVKEHMPPAHQKYIEWSPARLYKWAEKVGPATRKLIEKVIKMKFHPQQGFRPAMGILRLGKTYGDDRLEAAAQIALRFDFVRVRQISDLLKHGKDKKATPTICVANKNTRGRTYYSAEDDQKTLPL
jgi:transposase